jgi:probable F420-dependent oxidoreductase
VFTPVRFGLFAINYGSCGDPDAAVRVAQHAEAAGFESVWTGEHIVLPDPQPDGFSLPPTLPLLDTVVALTLIAAHTTTIAVASGVVVLPLHNPVVLAKQLASIDVVSNGRLIVGVGAGYVAAEFDAVGVPMAGRGARMDDYLDAMQALWSTDHPHHLGPYVSIAGVDAHPRPVGASGPPVVVGGGSRAALRRAITRGDGWYGFNVDPDMTAQFVLLLDRMADEVERPSSLGPLELTVTPVGPLDEAVIDRYEQLGVTRMVLLPQPDADRAHRHSPVPVERILRNIDDVAERFIDR